MIDYRYKFKGKEYIFATNEDGDGFYQKDGDDYRMIIATKDFTTREIQDKRMKMRRTGLKYLSQL